MGYLEEPVADRGRRRYPALLLGLAQERASTRGKFGSHCRTLNGDCVTNLRTHRRISQIGSLLVLLAFAIAVSAYPAGGANKGWPRNSSTGTGGGLSTGKGGGLWTGPGGGASTGPNGGMSMGPGGGLSTGPGGGLSTGPGGGLSTGPGEDSPRGLVAAYQRVLEGDSRPVPAEACQRARRPITVTFRQGRST